MLANNIHQQIFEFNPSIIFMQVGGNDITPDEHFTTTAIKLLNFVRLFTRKGYVVKTGEIAINMI